LSRPAASAIGRSVPVGSEQSGFGRRFQFETVAHFDPLTARLIAAHTALISTAAAFASRVSLYSGPDRRYVQRGDVGRALADHLAHHRTVLLED
jgi:hypothetical protein